MATALLPTTSSPLPQGYKPTRDDLSRTSLQASYLSLHWGSSNPIPRRPRTCPPPAHLLFPLGDSGLPGQEPSCTYPPPRVRVCTPGRHYVFIYFLHHYLSALQNESFLQAGSCYIPDARAWHVVGTEPQPEGPKCKMSLSSGRAEGPLWLVLWSREAGGRTVSRAGREGVGRCGLVVFERKEAPLQTKGGYPREFPVLGHSRERRTAQRGTT